MNSYLREECNEKKEIKNIYLCKKKKREGKDKRKKKTR